MPNTQPRVCRKCNTSTLSAEKFLVTCKYCKRHWHHSCLEPAMSEAELITLMKKIKQLPHPSSELEVWPCRRCERRRQSSQVVAPKDHDEIQILEPPPGITQGSTPVPNAPTSRTGRSPASADTSVPRATQPVELDDDDIVMMYNPPARQPTASTQRPNVHDIRIVKDIPDIIEFGNESGVLTPTAPRTAATTSAQSPLNLRGVMAPVQASAIAPATAIVSTAFQAYQSPLGRHITTEKPPVPQVPTRSTTAASLSRASATEPAIAGLLDAPFADMFVDIQAQAARLRAPTPASGGTLPRVSVATSDTAAASPSPERCTADEAEAQSVEVKLERRDSTEDLRTPTRGSTAAGRKPRVPLLLHVEMERLASDGGPRDEWDDVLDFLSSKATEKADGSEVRRRKAGGKQAKKLGPKAKAKREFLTVGLPTTQ